MVTEKVNEKQKQSEEEISSESDDSEIEFNYNDEDDDDDDSCEDETDDMKKQDTESEESEMMETPSPRKKKRKKQKTDKLRNDDDDDDGDDSNDAGDEDDDDDDIKNDSKIISKQPRKKKRKMTKSSNTDILSEDEDVSDDDDDDDESQEEVSQDEDDDDDDDDESEEEVSQDNDDEEEASENDEKEEEASENDDEEEEEEKVRTGFANVLSNILSKKTVSSKKVILAQGKTDREIMKHKENQIPLEERESKEPVLTTEELEEQKLKRKVWLEMSRVKPNPLERNREKELKMIATRGVVQLFNAVKKQQKMMTENLSNVSSERKRDLVIESMNKKSFINLLQNTKVDVSLQPVEKEKTDAKESERKIWNVLKDDFVIGTGKMKDWDKQDNLEDL